MKAATAVALAENPLVDISIHAAREGGDLTVCPTVAVTPRISIHAAREGGDRGGDFAPGELDISIHAAREGGDAMEHRPR